MKKEPGTTYQMLHCRVCSQPLASTEGDDILKYFLVSGNAPGGLPPSRSRSRKKIERASLRFETMRQTYGREVAERQVTPLDLT